VDYSIIHNSIMTGGVNEEAENDLKNPCRQKIANAIVGHE
jgi:hypothetical protein